MSIRKLYKCPMCGEMRYAYDFYKWIGKNTECCYGFMPRHKTNVCVECQGKEEYDYNVAILNPRSLGLPHYYDTDVQDKITSIMTIVEPLLDSLTDRERTILIHKFGLYGNLPETNAKIGVKYFKNMSRERIRQILTNTLAKLRRLYSMALEEDEH